MTRKFATAVMLLVLPTLAVAQQFRARAVAAAVGLLAISRARLLIGVRVQF